jgi:tetratricopeptide (TPR) repeat protein
MPPGNHLPHRLGDLARNFMPPLPAAEETLKPAGVLMIARCNWDPGHWQKLWWVRSLLCSCLLVLCTAALAVDAREALQNAANLVQQGRLQEADRQTHLALSDPDTRAVACSVLGTIRFQQKRLGESAAFLQEAIRLEPHLLGAHLSLAEVYLLQNKPGLALGLYRQILELDPLNSTARLALARAESEKGNYQRSLDLAGPIFPALKQIPDGLFLLATDYLKIGARAAAASLANDWMRLADTPPAWSMKFALLLAHGGVVPEAIEILERARQAGPTSYELAFNLAGVYLLKNDRARALEYYDLALSLHPDAVPALRQAAEIAEQQGELERALSYWIRLKKIDSNDSETLLGFGRVCLKMDLLEDAEPALTQAASLRPDDPSYLYALAATKVGKRQFEAADGLLKDLVNKKPDDSQLQYALGSVLYLEGHLADADQRLRESVRLRPDQLAPYYYLALVARDQGNEADAIQRLEELLRRYPDHALSCEALGGLLMSAHRYSEAENNLEKAVRLNPKSVKANYQLGLLLARIGKKDEADKRLEIAKSLRTEDESTSRLQLRLLDPDR